MKRVLIAAALASLLLGWSPSPAAAEAQVGNFSGSVEVSNLLAQGCDEWIRFAGTVRAIYVKVSLPTGFDTFVFTYRETANLVGIGETSGTTYRLMSMLGQTTMERDDQIVSGTLEISAKISGGGQIFTFKAVQHLTVTPAGDVAVFFENLRVVDGCSA